MALTLAQLKRSLHLTETIEKLQAELSSIFGGVVDVITPSSSSGKKTRRKKRKMSAAGRANIIAAQKARWAKVKAAKTAAPTAKGKPGRKKAAKKAA